MYVYVASSWRNAFQPYVVQTLRSEGHEVYDFRHPAEGVGGFSWSEIDPDWKDWSAKEFVEGLKHPKAVHGYMLDFIALDRCEACVMVLPCGASAHTEIGYCQGQHKRTVVLFPDEKLARSVAQNPSIRLGPQSDGTVKYYSYGRHVQVEPELMYKMFDFITDSVDEVVESLRL